MFFKLFLIAILVFFAIDMVWLGWAAKSFYSNQIGHLLKSDVNWTAAIIFYLIFVAGLVFFVIQPAVSAGSLSQALLHGAVYGLVTYATYDLTNLALAKDWPLLVTIVDLIWGTVLAAAVSSVTFMITTKLGI